MSKNSQLIIVGIIIGVIVTVAAVNFMVPVKVAEESISAEPEPIYWVAPMDANYRKDKPGKSPMGMDLVPVYEDGDKTTDQGQGTIRISPDVINNLGVRTELVSYKSLQTKINTVGYVTYDEDKLVHIHPRVQGWIEKLHIKSIGEPVQKGQPLYEIYSPELVNAQEELILATERQNTRLITAAVNRLNALQLPKKAIEKLKKTRQVEQTITFYSPQNGVVENLKIREGFFVNPGSTIMSIGDLSEVWVEGEVFERQAAQVSTGTPITMTLDYLPGKTWHGQVDYIYPTLDAKTRTVKVRLRFKNANRYFKPNMFAQITIHTRDNESALLIPKEALIRTGNQDRVVLALGEGSFKSVAVSVGRYDNEHVEILSGLNVGERVVSSAQFLLDSESSKSSDFTRMNSGISSSEPVLSNKVWVSAEIQSKMAEHNRLTLVHEAIPVWDWPAMTMDFVTAESVDLSGLKAGMNLHVEVTKSVNGDYTVTNIHIPDDTSMHHPPSHQQSSALIDNTHKNNEHKDSIQSAEVNSATVTGTINSITFDNGTLNISRSAIEKWQRPPATLDFIGGKEVNLDTFSEGMNVVFTFVIIDGDFIIVEMAQLTDSDKMHSSSNEDASIDHSQHLAH